MPRVKKVEVEESAPQNQNVKVPQGAEEFKALMEAYEEQNPLKYADKKEAFEKKLAALSK